MVTLTKGNSAPQEKILEIFSFSRLAKVEGVVEVGLELGLLLLGYTAKYPTKHRAPLQRIKCSKTSVVAWNEKL
jgi:hypothetical protein